MFDFSPKTALSGPDTLDLVELLLKTAQKSDKKSTQLALCGHVDTYLGTMKKFVKRPSPSTAGSNTANTDSNEEDHLLRQRIAKAYHDHANLLKRLDHLKMAQESERREGLWGGPVTSKTVASAAKLGKPDVVTVTVLDRIFPVDYRPFSTEWLFPAPDDRVSDTPQLVSCLGLLKQASVDFPDDALDPEARKWLKKTARNQEEKTRLETLATDIVRAFIQDEIKDEKAVTEVLCLAPVLKPSDFRFLLGLFVKNLNESPLLDFGAVRGVAQLLRSASPGQLLSDDLIRVLEPISARLQATHTDSPENIFKLMVAVSSVLDAMADSNVRGLNRVEMHEPLLLFLGGLRKNDDLHLKFLASYVFQALLCVPNDESSLQAAVRRTTTIVRGISGLVTAVKSLDLNAFTTGLKTIGEGLDGILQVWESGKNIVEGFSTIHESEQDILAILKEAFTRDQRRPWYRALRGADILLNSGELTKFRTLVCEAVCRLDAEFQWGICQRLGEVAANPRWDMEARQGAVSFLEEIYRNDLTWGHLPPIKGCILVILKSLSVRSEDLPDAASLLESLALEEDVIKQAIYRDFLKKAPTQYSLTSEPLEVAPSALIDRVQKRMKVDRELRQMFRRRERERDGAVYVPPMAKSSLQASDESALPLIPEVDAFLKSKDKKVLLLLGDSGVGKTTFNRELDLRLWKDYMKEPKTSRIPLLISLPAIERPEKDLIAKHLRLCEFNESQIAELKRREFVIICDGYDESQQSQNLYKASDLNKENGWKAQMIISCRSERLGKDYRDLFQPPRQSLSDPDSFLQAILVPFSEGQVKQYITEYVRIKKPLWEAKDYNDVLDQIPSLQELVKNPFLLTLSLEVLPRLADPGQTLTTNKITRVQLYDEFVAQWLERNKKKLGNQALSDQEKEAFESLSDDGFTLQGFIFLRRLSATIYKEQRGNPVVEYSKARDIDSWKEEFFGRKDGEIRLLRKALPLTRNGTQFGFIHRSILEYGVSRAIYEPQKQAGVKLQAVGTSNSRKSMESTLSFEDDEEKPTEKPDQADQGLNADSPLAKRSFVKDTSVIQFLAERVEQEPEFRKQLQDYLDASKKDKKWRIAAANAITVLVRAGVRFNGADLKGIQIPGADISGGQFDSAQLEGADMRKVNLRNTWIRQANLSKAHMVGVQFGEWLYLEQGSAVKCCSYSPDGRTFVCGAEDGTISVYDTTTWAKLHTLQGHTSSVTSVAYSPSSHQVASGSDDETLQLWDAQTGAPGHILSGHTSWVNSVVYSPSGYQVASCSDDHTARLWDTQTGTPGPVLSGHTGPVHSVVYSPSGRQVASGSDDNTVRLWNTQTGAPGSILIGHTGPVLSVVYSPTGRQVASGSADNTVRLWNTQTGEPGTVLSGHTSDVRSVVYSPSGHQVASGSGDKTVRLWDTQTGAPGPILIGHLNSVRSVVYSPSGRQIASCSADTTVRLWDTQTGTPGPVLMSHTSDVRSVVYSPSGHQVASGSLDKTVRLWDTQTSAPSPILSGHTYLVQSVAYSPSGHQVASGSDDNTVRLWDMKTGAPGPVLIGHTSRVHNVVYSPSGHQVASGSADNTVRLWGTQTGARGPVLSGHTSWVNIVVYSPSGHQVASCSADKTVRLWDTQTGAPGPVLTGHTASVRSVVYSPSGHQVASGSVDKTVRLWETQTGTPGLVLIGHTSWVQSVAYSPSGHQVASGSDDKTVRLWDAQTGAPGLILSGHFHHIRSVVYSPCGRQVASGSDDKTVRLWDIQTGAPGPVLSGHTSVIRSVVYSPSSHQVASGSNDSTMRLWDANSGQCLLVVKDFHGAVATIAWKATANGTYFVTGSHKSVRMWQLIEDEGNFRSRLHWSSMHDRLAASDASLEDVRGLSRSNMRLLRQRGAVGEPLMALQVASNTMSTVTTAALKFKQLRNGKTTASAPTVDSSVRQLDV